MSNSEELIRDSLRKKTSESEPPRGSGGMVVKVVLVLIALGVGAWWMQKQKEAKDAKDPSAKTGSPFARGEVPPVPVTAGTVAQKDVPLYLDGIATVQAFNTVTIRTRVDGQLQKVAFTEGQDVRQGDLLAQIDPDPFRAQMEQAAAKKGQDEAMLANARVDLKRYADLLKTEGVTQQVYDTQKALVDQLEAGIKADQAAVENTKVQLAYTTILSPIEGRVGIRAVDQGNIVHANDASGLVVITQLKPISVVFTLPAKSLGKIQARMALSGPDLSVVAIGEDDTTVLGEGRLAVIDNEIDTTTSTIKLKATFPNTDLRLWPGQFVNARLLLTVRKDGVIVPSQVIQRGPEGPFAAFAFVIKDDQTVEMRPVKVASIEKGEALIDEGLQPGERVVVDGQYKLQSGSRVRVSDGAGGGGAKPPGAAEKEGRPSAKKAKS